MSVTSLKHGREDEMDERKEVIDRTLVVVFMMICSVAAFAIWACHDYAVHIVELGSTEFDSRYYSLEAR